MSTSDAATPTANYGNLQSGQHGWTVTNNTDQTIMLGEFYKNVGKDYSGMDFGKNGLAPGEHNGAYVADEHIGALEYTWGRVCYSHTWWNLQRLHPIDTHMSEMSEIHLITRKNADGVRLLAHNRSGSLIEMTPTSEC